MKSSSVSSKKNNQTEARKRGRPTIEQAEAIGDHILRCAQDLFLSDGYAQTTMEAVATTAGISKGTLYARFATKGDVFHALVVDRLAAWSQLTPVEAEMPGTSLFDYLHRRGTALLTALADPEIRAFSHLVNSESRQFPELAEDFRTQAYDLVISEIAEAVDRSCEASDRPAIDPKGLALVFVSALLGWGMTRPQDRDIPAGDAASYLARVLALLVGGRAAF